MIKSIRARQIYDSRGNPTIEVDVETADGTSTAAVPSGASTGIYEAVELRDHETAHHGKGVLNAVRNVNDKIGPALMAENFMVTQQQQIDELMCRLDGTDNKSHLGANAILGVSLAICKAGAVYKNMPLYKYIAELANTPKLVLPVPAFNLINGGAHAGNKLAIQEMMILPVGAKTFREAMQIGTEVYHHLKKIIIERYGNSATAVGDEGGFAPDVEDGEDALQLIMDALVASGHFYKCVIGMDAAASEIYNAGMYNLGYKSDTPQWVDAAALATIYRRYIERFGVKSIEDGFDQNDWANWTLFLRNNSDIQVVGDDLTVSNPARIRLAAERGACNCLLLKPNQIGTLSESIEAAKLARDNGWSVMISHRSGETEDTTIADLAVGLANGQIKSGAPCRSERVSKYNRLLRIEEELGAEAVYAGWTMKAPVNPTPINTVQCNGCRSNIAALYYEVCGHAYCYGCYTQLFSPKCSVCQVPLEDICIVEMGKHWHVDCFRCAHCDEPLMNAAMATDVYYEVQGLPYHYDCHFIRRWEIENEGHDDNEHV